MIKLFYHKEYFKEWSSELIFIYQDIIKNNKIDDDRFFSLNNLDVYTIVDKIEECDFIILPYKWNGFTDITKKILTEGRIHNKKLIVVFNDDSYENIDLDIDEAIIFRTSFLKTTQKSNEFSIPAFINDSFKNNILQEKKLNIGFCGYNHYERKKALEILLLDKDINCDFIIRKSFWAQEIKKEVAIKEFINNVESNIFSFTSRGSGNFSYRFYEILSMGRIPVLLNTDCVLPFDNILDYNQHCLIIDISDIQNISNKLKDFFKEKTISELIDIQENNRKLYLEYLSPEGFLNNSKLILEQWKK